jgi:peptidoglycan-associated lipoprotein
MLPRRVAMVTRRKRRPLRAAIQALRLIRHRWIAMFPAPMFPAPIPGTQEDLVQNVGDRVFFEYDSAVLTPEGRRTLERQAEWLRLFPELNITLEGHCDERGTREYNLALGERRATAARDYLIAFGLNSSRLRSTSYGKERPYALGHNEESWSPNRRAVTVVN